MAETATNGHHYHPGLLARRDAIKDQFHVLFSELSTLDFPVFKLSGQLIRPFLAYSVAEHLNPSLIENRSDFWKSLIAIQMIHEASLVHDDIIDEADTRRGLPTINAVQGDKAALVFGDHLITTAYYLMTESGSLNCVKRFSYCVEKTVRGEIAQAKHLGENLSLSQYEEIIRGKTGELFGLAFSSAFDYLGSEKAEAAYSMGLQVGMLYQILDDLIDYLPSAESGKPPYQDFYQNKWTFPRFFLNTDLPPDSSPETIHKHYFNKQQTNAPMEQAIEAWERRRKETESQLTNWLNPDSLVFELLESWNKRLRTQLNIAQTIAA